LYATFKTLTAITSNNMASTTETITNGAHQIMGKPFLRGAKEEQSFGDFRDDLQRDGFAVVKGAVPRERADQYAEEMFQWLEDLYVEFLHETTRALA
jgi:hypothetical protein